MMTGYNTRITSGWNKTWRWLAAMGSGLLLASAYPPMSSSESAWAAFVPLLIVAWYSRPSASFKYGFVSGAAFWLCSLSWLLALGRTGAPLALAAVGWIALSLYCALYTGLFLLLASWLIERCGMAGKATGAPVGRRMAQLTLVFLLPVVWVGTEYIRSTLLTGFPWNALGVSQYRHAGLIQMAAWGGVYAVSALIMLVNAALTITVLRAADTVFFRRASRFHPELMVALLAVLGSLVQGNKAVRVHGRGCPDGTAVTVRVVQPNIPQLKKWPDEFTAMIYDRLRANTELALMGQPHLVVWPETSLPQLVEYDPQAAAFTRDLASRGTPLLVGSMEQGPSSDTPVRLSTGSNGVTRHADDQGRPWVPRYYNSAFLFDGRGEVVGRYRKRHLVPFGEYLPFDQQFSWIQRMAPLGFSCAAGDQAVVFDLPAAAKDATLLDSSARVAGPERAVAFSALICFEDVFAYLARDAVLAGARMLVNQTNDAWFDGTSASVQHFSHAVFRCVENRVPMARSANTGVSGFIDRAGRLERMTQTMVREGTTDQAQYLTEDMCVPGQDMPLTFYTRYGDRFFAQPAGIAVALGLIALGLPHAARRRRSPDGLSSG